MTHNLTHDTKNRDGQGIIRPSGFCKNYLEIALETA